MKVEFVRENSGNYMQIAYGEGDSFEMKMLRNNAIPGFLEITPRQINNKFVYLYNITGRSNLSEAYSKRKMSSEELYKLIDCLKSAIEHIRSYLLDDSGLMLDADYIYKGNNDEKYYFTYFNVKEGTLWDNIKTLFEFIIGVLDHNDNEAVTLGYGIYKRLCTNQTSIDELFTYERSPNNTGYEVVTENIIEENVIPEVRIQETETVDKYKLYGIYAVFAVLGTITAVCMFLLVLKRMYIAGLAGVLAAVMIYILNQWYKKNKGLLVKIERKEIEIPYVRENVRVIMPKKEHENLTTVLNQTNINEHMLEWQENGMMNKYPLKKETVIGCSQELADCIISVPGISRTHAKVIIEDNNYYIKDLNSTNGTKVNDVELASYQMMPISPGDVIKIGNISVLFH